MIDVFLTFAFLFFLGSTIGWVLELFYRRFFSAGRWLNPGFLTGPYLPLYGFGLCFLYLLASIDLSGIPSDFLRTALLLLTMGVAMTLIEYVAGKIFIVGMKVKLWDYSRKRGNIEGLICPEFSLYWTLLGALYYYVIHPRVTGAVHWLFGNLAFSFIVGFFFGVFAVDFAHSVRLLTRLRTFATENRIVIKLEELKRAISVQRERERGKLRRFIFAFRANIPFAEELAQYARAVRERADERVNADRRTDRRDGKEPPSEENRPQP